MKVAERVQKQIRKQVGINKMQMGCGKEKLMLYILQDILESQVAGRKLHSFIFPPFLKFIMPEISSGGVSYKHWTFQILAHYDIIKM